MELLPLVFALAQTLEHGKTGFFGVGDGHGFELMGGAEVGNELPHRLFAGRAMRERLGRQRAVQREPAAADLALAFTKLVFVERHTLFSIAGRRLSNEKMST